MASRYKRLLLKISGEMLMCSEAFDIQAPGHGNVVDERGDSGRNERRCMGVLATVMNALAPESRLKAAGAQARVQSAIFMPGIASPIRGAQL